MKKLLILLYIVASILIFTFVNISFKEKNISDAYRYLGYKDTEFYKSIVFDGNLNSLNMDDFIDDLYNFNDREHDPVTYVVLDANYDDLEFSYYVLSDYTVEEVFQLEGVNVNMTEINTEFIASTDSSKSQNVMNFINKELKVDVIPLRNFSDKSKILIDVFSSPEAIERLSVEIHQKYEDFDPVIMDFANNQFDYDGSIKDSMVKILSISIILVMIVFLFYLSNSMRDISILKLQGYSTIAIFRYLLFNDILKMVCTILIINVGLFWVRVGFISTSSKLMINYLIQYNVLLFVFLIVTSLAFIVGIKFLSLSSLIKGRNLNKVFATTSYCIKILAIILLVPMASHSLKLFITESSNLIHLMAERDNYTHSNIIPRYLESYRERPTNFIGSSDQTDDEAYIAHAKLVDELSELGAEYVSNSGYYVDALNPKKEGKEINILMVNENFVFKHLKQDLSERVNEKLKNNEMVLIIDVDTKEKYDLQLENILEVGRSYATIETRLDSYFFTYNKPHPQIIIVYANDGQRLNKTVFSDMILNDIPMNEVTKVISSNGFNDQFLIESMSEDYYSLYRYSINTLSIELLSVVPIILLLLVVAFSFYETYRKANHQSIVVKTIHGYPRLLIYHDYLLESFLPIILVLFINRDNALYAISILLFIELIIWLVITVKSSRRKMSSFIKREEI